jgi:SAM-dependent methyltransferase
MSQFSPEAYWEQRLEDDYSLSGVGFKRLGPSFNRWAYQVRRERFFDIVAEHVEDPRAARVLDVGSGTGFYVDLWKELGASSIVGVDLTRVAVERLSQRHPHLTFHQLDIGEGTGPLPEAGFDVVDAMDVLFHIVDDARFQAAVQNLYRLVAPGGLFIFSDNFVHGDAIRVEHQATRSLEDIERAVRQTGFEIVDRQPMFVVMNTPLDVRSRIVRGAWYGAAGAISLWDRLGDVAGRALVPLELRLCRNRSESPTTEIMVCRRPRLVTD